MTAQITPRAANHWMSPITRVWPMLMVPSMAPWLRLPNNEELDGCGPTLACLMVALPMAITFATITTRVPKGDTDTVAGAMASIGTSIMTTQPSMRVLYRPKVSNIPPQLRVNLGLYLGILNDTLRQEHSSLMDRA